MEKYMGRWSVNNGGTYGSAEFDNKRDAIRWTRAVCRGNLFTGNIGKVSVVDRNGEIVYEGEVRS